MPPAAHLFTQKSPDVEFQPDPEQEQRDTEFGQQLQFVQALDAQPVEQKPCGQEPEQGWQPNQMCERPSPMTTTR